MRIALAAALVSFASLASSSSAATGRNLLLLERPGAPAEDEALLDALRIYSSDLDRAVAVATQAPPPPGVEDLAERLAAGRRAGAEVVLWLGSDGEHEVLFALFVDTLELRSLPVPSSATEARARTLALKLRALLEARRAAAANAPPAPAPATGANAAAPATPTIANTAPSTIAPAPPATVATAPPATSAKPPSPTSANPSTATSAGASPPTSAPPIAAPSSAAGPAATSTAPAPARSSASPTIEVRRAPSPPQPPSRLEIGVGYLLGVPTDPRLLSHDAVARLIAPLGRLPLALALDVAAGSRPTVGPPGYHVTVYDVPIGLSLVGRLRRGRWLLAAGPRASVHVWSAGADAADGRSGAAHTVSAGLGALAEARLAIASRVDAALTVTGEALVPQQRFTVDGADGASPGPFLFSASLGLVVRLF